MEPMETMTEQKPKRKPGRPKGSKTKKRTAPPDDVAPAGAPALTPVPTEDPEAPVELVEVTVRVPLAPLPDGYCKRRMDLSELTPKQAETVARLRAALHANHAQRANGRHVESGADALRWLLDAITRQLGG